MSRALLGGTRFRILDENGNPPSAAAPWRLSFWDAVTSNPKQVYYYKTGGIGVQVQVLDSEGYVPVTGLFLDPGYYSMRVQKQIANTGIDANDWQTMWTLPDIPGGTEDAVVDTETVRVFGSVSEMKAATPGGMAYLTGYYAINDGGQGPISWSPDSTKGDNGGTVFLPTGQSIALPGRWLRVFTSENVSVQQFGACTGRPDVTASILAAEGYCGRTAEDSGRTLVFPAGTYNLGTSDITLDLQGLTPGGSIRPINKIIKANAIFDSSDTVGPPSSSATISFGGSVQVEGEGRIISSYANVIFLGKVNDGSVLPTWWGADATGAFPSDYEFVKMYTGMGDNSIRMNGTFDMAGIFTLAHTNTDGTRPTLIMPAGASLNIQDSPASGMEVGTIICDKRNSARRAFTGDYAGLQIYANHLDSSWFDISTVDKLKKLTGVANYAPYVFNWSEVFTWDSSYNCTVDGGANIRHTFSPAISWFINNATVVVSEVVAPDSKWIYFASAGNTGTLNILATYTYKSTWFGAVGAGQNISLNHLVRNALAVGADIDFQRAAVSISTPLAIGLGTSSLSLRNMILTGTATGQDVLTVSGTGYFELFDSKLTHVAGSTRQLLGLAVGSSFVDRCIFTNGVIGIANSGDSRFENNQLTNCGSYGQVTSSGKSFVDHNIFTETPVGFSGNSNTNLFSDLYVRYNTYYAAKPTTDGIFVAIAAGGTGTRALNIRFKDNEYYATAGGTGTAPTSVKDITDGVTNGSWTNGTTFSHMHDIIIEDRTGRRNVLPPAGMSPAYRPVYVKNTIEEQLYINNSPGASGSVAYTFGGVQGGFRLVGVTSSEAIVLSAGAASNYAHSASVYGTEPSGADADGAYTISWAGTGAAIRIAYKIQILL